MACDNYTIYQGDTGPILEVRPSNLASATTLDANWVCYIAAMDTAGTNVVVKRAITDKTSDDKYFITALTPTETGTLTTSIKKPVTYIVAVEVSNTTTTPAFNEETQYNLKVLAEGVV